VHFRRKGQRRRTEVWRREATRMGARAINPACSESLGVSHLWLMIASPRDKHGGLGRLYVTARGSCRYVIPFLCLKRPSSSVGALWGYGPGATRPRQMFRDACPFASAYYVLVLGIRTYAGRATRDRARTVRKGLRPSFVASSQGRENSEERTPPSGRIYSGRSKSKSKSKRGVSMR